MTLCACGCGQELTIKPHNKRRYERLNYIPKFVLGHDSKTKEAREAFSKRSKGRNQPKGKDSPCFGKHISEEQRKIQSIKMRGKNTWSKGCHQTKESNDKRSASLKGKLPSPKTGYGTMCRYQSPLQGEVCLRSTFELAYAKYLDSIHELWMYEMETFDLGSTTYTPDFFLPRLEKFIEIKGYMLPKAQEKINQFREQYPWDLDVLGLKELKLLGAK